MDGQTRHFSYKIAIIVEEEEEEEEEVPGCSLRTELSSLRPPPSMLGVCICVSWEKGHPGEEDPSGFGEATWTASGASSEPCRKHVSLGGKAATAGLSHDDGAGQVTKHRMRFCKCLLPAPSPASSIFYHNLGFQWSAAHTPPLSPPARVLVLLPHIPALPLGAPSLYRGLHGLLRVQEQGPHAQSSSAPSVTANKEEDTPATPGREVDKEKSMKGMMRFSEESVLNRMLSAPPSALMAPDAMMSAPT